MVGRMCFISLAAVCILSIFAMFTFAFKIKENVKMTQHASNNLPHLISKEKKLQR